MTDGWDPSDGAGYIPTEEGGNKASEFYDPKDELIERLEREAQDVADNPRPRQTQAYANGVAAGIRYVIGELKDE